MNHKILLLKLILHYVLPNKILIKILKKKKIWKRNKLIFKYILFITIIIYKYVSCFIYIKYNILHISHVIHGIIYIVLFSI